MPRPPDSFLGRSDELTRLLKFLQRHHLLLLKGIAGIGKTSLALALCQALKRQETPPRILYLRCQDGWKLEDLLHEAHAWLEGFGESGLASVVTGSSADLSDKILALISLLNENAYVVLVDDFHLLSGEDVTTFINLMHTYLASRILFVSREDLPIPPFARVDIYEEKLEGLPPGTAAELLSNLLAAHGLAAADGATLAILVERVGGHPLLLKMLASLLLARQLDLKEVSSRGMGPEVRSYLLSQVVGQVSAAQRCVLEALSLSAGTVAANSLGPLLDLEAGQALVALESSFLVERGAGGEVAVHRLIADHVAADLQGAARTSLHLRLAAHFEAAGQSQAAFHHFLEGGDGPGASRVLVGAASRMCAEGHYELLIDDASRLEAIEPNLDPLVRIMKGNAFSVLGRWQDSLDTLQGVAEQPCDSAVRVECLLATAGVYLNTGDLFRACEEYEKALRLIDAGFGSGAATKCLNYLAYVCGVRGHVRRGRELVARSLDIAARENSAMARAHALRVQATIHDVLGEYDEALQVAQETGRLAAVSQSSRLVCWARDLEGRARLGRGEPEAARVAFQQNLEEARRLGDTQVAAFSYAGLGMLARQRGSLAEATEAFASASRNFVAQGNPLGDATARRQAALARFEAGDRDGALPSLERCRAAASKFGHFRLEADILLDLCEVDAEVGDLGVLASRAAQALSILEGLQVPELTVRARLYGAEAALRRNERSKARQLAQSGLDGCDPRRHAGTAWRAHFLMNASASKGDHDEQEALLRSLLVGLAARQADRLSQRLQETIVRRFRVMVGDRCYFAEEAEVERLRGERDSYALFMDVPGRQLRVRHLGEVPIFRKPILSSLLLALMEATESGLTAKDLFTRVWGYRYEGEGSDGEVRKNISRLRELVEPDRKNPCFIKHAEGFMKSRGAYYFDRSLPSVLILADSSE